MTWLAKSAGSDPPASEMVRNSSPLRTISCPARRQSVKFARSWNPDMRSPDPVSPSAPAREVLESWKEIAVYVGRSVRTVQLWEKEEDFPVHRHQHDKQGTVFAYRDEVDRWRQSRSAPPRPVPPQLVFPAPHAPPATQSPRGRWLAAVALAASVACTVVFALLRLPEPRLAPPAIRSIAVLPFTNSDPRAGHVSDGLTELLIDDLASIPDLRVMARSSVFRYKRREVSPARTGQELKVDAVVTGDLRRETGRFVIRLELIDVRDGAQLWSGSYPAQTASLPVVQRRMAEELARELRGERAAPAPRRTAAKYPPRPEAYEQYLLGLREWNDRRRESLVRSVAHFRRATELDPQFAAAYAGLANAYGVMVGYGQLTASEGTLLTLAAARKALELDPGNAEAHTSIASSSFRSLWDFSSAERDYRRAIHLNPSYATAHQWYGEYLEAMGRFPEARREIETAFAIDPLSAAITSDLCWISFAERRYEQAIAFGRDVEARDPSRTPERCITNALLATGQFDEVLRRLEARSAPAAASLAEAYRKGGPRGFYSARLQGFLRFQPRPEPIIIARHHALLGDRDQAFVWLEKAFEGRASGTPSFHVDPAFDAIRDDARFRALARRIGLPSSALDATDALARQLPNPRSGSSAGR
jgi:TolB-like protein/cytochrome c-type biogenesis protein CcmH/NrfG